MSEIKVPFSRPVFLPCMVDGLTRVALSSRHCGLGPETFRTESILEARFKVPVKIVTSATHALEMMSLLIGVGPSDEVIVPSFTFVSTASAFALRGARVVFADVDQFGNLELSEVWKLMTRKTKAIVAVDYGGNSVDIDKLREAVRIRSLDLEIERPWILQDSAQSIGGTYNGQALGATADLACISFHETKNISSGEGGALIIGTRDLGRRQQLVERAEIIREKGTDRSKFFRGQVDKYTWVGLGSSYVLSEINAAMLPEQLEQLDSITARRRHIWDTYFGHLVREFDRVGASIILPPEHNTPNGHMFAVLMRSLDDRSRLIQGLKFRGVVASFHYQPLHSSKFALETWGEVTRPFYGTERLSDCLVRLPLFYNLKDWQIDYTIEAVREVLGTLHSK